MICTHKLLCICLQVFGNETANSLCVWLLMLYCFFRHGQINTCSICHKTFKGRTEFVNHQKVYHPNGKKGTVRCKEEGCHFAGFRVSQLAEHLKDDHKLEVKMFHKVFNKEEGKS